MLMLRTTDISPKPPAVEALSRGPATITVPPLMFTSPVKVFAPDRVRLPEETVRPPVPEMMPPRVWAAELLNWSMPVLAMAAV